MQSHCRDMPRGARRVSPRSLLRAGLRPRAAAGCAAPGACAARLRHRWPESARPPRAGRRPPRARPCHCREPVRNAPSVPPGAGGRGRVPPLPAPMRDRRMPPGSSRSWTPHARARCRKVGRAPREGRKVRTGAGSRDRAVRARAPRGTRLPPAPRPGARAHGSHPRALAPSPAPLRGAITSSLARVGNFFCPP
jgi:hypothetical protein